MTQGERSGATSAPTALELWADARFHVPGQEFQELWFTLARRAWRCLAVVPVDDDESAGHVARSLTDVGRMLDDRVTFFALPDSRDYASAAQIVPAVGTAAAAPGRALEVAGKLIVALQPVVVEPLGLTITATADAVIVCVQMGRTKVATARRTIELIGRERIAGCVIVR